MFIIHLIDRQRSIGEDKLRLAIKSLPERLLGDWPVEDETGWSLATEVAINENPDQIKYVTVSGTDALHARFGLDMALALTMALQMLGHHIEIFSFTEGYTPPHLYSWLGYNYKEFE